MNAAAQIYYSVFTKKGLELLTDAIQNGTKLGITSMAFGDGGGVLPEPNDEFESLINEVHRTPLNSLGADPQNANWLRAEAIIASAIGGFNIRELGLYAGNELVAYSNYPPTFKPNPSDGTARIMTFRLILQIENTSNFELIIDPDVVLATRQYVDNQNKTLQSGIDTIDQKIDQTSIFGSSGMSIPVGAKHDAHHGWGGIVRFKSGKWVLIYRKGSYHGIKNGSELRAIDSFDEGRNWTNDRLITVGATHDLRPDPPKLMANNRGGLFVNRLSETANLHHSPYFIYSDDEFNSWTINTIETTAPYTFQGSGGLLEFPASVGGHDSLGFMSFGYLSAVGMDAFTTIDNGLTWQQHHEIAVPSGELASISEWTGCRIGKQDKWIFFTRSSIASGWNPKLIAWVTNNPLNWGSWKDTGLALGGNPPMCIYDETSEDIVLLNVSRGGRPIGTYPENALLQARINAIAAYNNNANFTALKIDYSVIASMPHWLTGYLAPFKSNGKWFTTLTCGELGYAGGGAAAQILLGDFLPSSTEMSKVVNFLIKQQKTSNLIELVSTDDAMYPLRIYSKNKQGYLNLRPDYIDIHPEGVLTTLKSTKPLKFDLTSFFGGLNSKIEGLDSFVQLGVPSSTTPAARSFTASTTMRQHYVFHNNNGAVGSIATSGNSTIFNTTSDETLKNFATSLSGEQALNIIKSDPVRHYSWKSNGEQSIGWGAQTSYAISKELASKGGWYNQNGDEVAEGTPGATYLRWGMDYSKRAPYLWAAIAYLAERLEALEQQNSGT